MIVLASQSPRRRALMQQMGLQFAVMAEDVDETMDPALPIEQEIVRVSRSKALAVQRSVSPEDVIVAADTMVCVDGRRLGKPRDGADAARMLRLLSGRAHTVVTGLSVVRGARFESCAVTTDIHFRPLSEAEIAAYIATGEPLDKAGAYGIQGRAAIFVDRLDGDYYNVMGLPVCALTQLLRRFGVQVLGEAACDL